MISRFRLDPHMNILFQVVARAWQEGRAAIVYGPESKRTAERLAILGFVAVAETGVKFGGERQYSVLLTSKGATHAGLWDPAARWEVLRAGAREFGEGENLFVALRLAREAAFFRKGAPR